MYRLEPTSSELMAAARVGESAVLTGVRISSISAVNRLDMSADPDSLFSRVAFGLVGFDSNEDGKMQVETGVRLLIGMKTLEDVELDDIAECPDGCALIELRMVGEYGIPKGEIPDDVKNQGLPAFAKYNGLHNMWSYFRQHLQEITCNMGLPPFVLSPLIVRARKPKTA